MFADSGQWKQQHEVPCMTTNTKMMVCLLIGGACGLTFALASTSAKHLSERRLDEEALSRMDGEGGSLATPLHEL